VRPTTLSTCRKQWRLIAADLGATPVRQLRTEQVAAFVSRMVDRGAASRAANIRTQLVQVLDEAVSLGLAETNVAKKVRRPKVPKVTRPTLTPVEVVKLLDACDERFVAVVAFCYLHGWRVSETLGLAWQDLDLEAGAARLRRGSTCNDGEGMVLGPTKTRRTAVWQLLGPSVVQPLRRRRELQALDWERVGGWPQAECEGEFFDLVFTTPEEKPMLRQNVDRAIRAARLVLFRVFICRLRSSVITWPCLR
jgi:integrase